MTYLHPSSSSYHPLPKVSQPSPSISLHPRGETLITTYITITALGIPPESPNSNQSIESLNIRQSVNSLSLPSSIIIILTIITDYSARFDLSQPNLLYTFILLNWSFCVKAYARLSTDTYPVELKILMQTIHYPHPYLLFPSESHSNLTTSNLHPHSQLHRLPPHTQDTRTQLFINNLPFRVRWQDLKDLFRKAGTVLRADVSLTLDNRSKGFGTVLFANRVDAIKALEIYNGFVWQTRVLDVRLDQQDPTGAIGMAAAASVTPASSAPPPQSKQKHHQQHSLHSNHLSMVNPHLLTSDLSHATQNSQPLPPSSLPGSLLQLGPSQLSSSVDTSTNPSNTNLNFSAININNHSVYPGCCGFTSTSNQISHISNTSSDPYQALSSPHPQQQQLGSAQNSLPPLGPSSESITDGSTSSSSSSSSSSLGSLAITSSSLSTRRLSSNLEFNPSINKPIPSYRKHQHSQSLTLLPLGSTSSDLSITASSFSSNTSQGVFSSSTRTNHRSSRSVHTFDFHVTPPASSAATHPTGSPTPISRPLDVHQPAFKPAVAPVIHDLSQLHITNGQSFSDRSTTVILPYGPNSSHDPTPPNHLVASADPTTESSLTGSISTSQCYPYHHHHPIGPNSNPPSSLAGSHSSQVHINPALNCYGHPQPYLPHHMPNTHANRATYPANPGFSSRLLYVSNLPFNFQWQDLKDLFRQAGNILRADVATKTDGRSRGFGTVLFANAEDASKALEIYNGYELKGRILNVHFDPSVQHSPSPSSGLPGVNAWNEHAGGGMSTPAHLASHHHQYSNNHFPDPTSAQPFEAGQDKPQPWPKATGHELSDTALDLHTPSNSHSSSHSLETSQTAAQGAEESWNEGQSELWAPEPVGQSSHYNGLNSRASLPIIVPPPPLSPIASRRSSFFKTPNHSNGYRSSTTNYDSSQHPDNLKADSSHTGPEPIGHPSNLTRPQAIPMPPPYDLSVNTSGILSPALPKAIQMTPSMPAFSFQAFMPATPPLLPNFFSPGIGPPSSPSYARGTPLALNRSVNSPLSHNPMFPTSPDLKPDTYSPIEANASVVADQAREVTVEIEDDHEGAKVDEKIEGSMIEEEEERTSRKVMDSNVDWGYQSSSSLLAHNNHVNRRASLFVGRTGSLMNEIFNPTSSSSSSKVCEPLGGGRTTVASSNTSSKSVTTNNRRVRNMNGFSSWRLLGGLGEELDDDDLRNSSRRASFDLRSLMIQNQPVDQQETGGRKQGGYGASNQLTTPLLDSSSIPIAPIANNEAMISSTTMTTSFIQLDDLNPLDQDRLDLKPETKDPSSDPEIQSNKLSQSQNDRLDLVGLGLVESIWTHKNHTETPSQ